MILCIGVDGETLRKRHRRLCNAGYESDARLLGEAIRAIQSCEYDMLIIGHKVPDDEARRVSIRFRRRSPLGKIVILHEGRRKGVDFADAVITHAEDAQGLVEAVKILSAAENGERTQSAE